MLAYVFLPATQQPWKVAAVLMPAKNTGPEAHLVHITCPAYSPYTVRLKGKSKHSSYMVDTFTHNSRTQRATSSYLRMHQPAITTYQNTDLKTSESRHMGWQDGSAGKGTCH